MNSKKTKEEWRIILQQRIQSGLSVRKWCDRNDIFYDTYKYWEKKLRHLEGKAPTQSHPTFVELPVSSAVQIPHVEGELYPFQIHYQEFRIGISKTSDINALADIMLSMITQGVEHIYLACGLFSGYFYPHLFTKIFVYKGF